MSDENQPQQQQQRLSEICRAQIFGRTKEIQVLRNALEHIRLVKDDVPISSLGEKHQVTSRASNGHIIESSEGGFSSTQVENSQGSTQSFKEEDAPDSSESSEPLHQHSGREFVFVDGKSGTGKTTLVRKAFQDSACLFCSGKFEEAGQPRPFSAISMCLGELCTAMTEDSNHNERRKDLYPSLIRNALDMDGLQILARLVPTISQVLDVAVLRGNTTTCSSAQSHEDLERLKFVLRKFLVAVSTQEMPVVMFWDDIQWMDVASFTLLKALLNNTELRHFLFVGSYRVDEVDQDHMVTKCMDHLPHRIRVSVRNLNKDDLTSMLQMAFGVKDYQNDQLESLGQLVDLVHTRTDGNIFHFLEILDFLQAEGLLKYDRLNFRWTWDLDQIQYQTNLSDNMVDIVITRIQRLPANVRELLEFCGLLGFRFDESLGASIFGHLRNLNGEDISVLLETLINEGLLESVHGRLKFVHDKVYQAATEVQSDAEQQHLTIGRELRKRIDGTSDTDDTNNMLFLCVDQLNMGRHLVLDKNEKRDLASLNLRAARTASRMSAFIPAAGYAEIGLAELDPSDRWTTCYATTLDLATLMAEMYAVTGDIDKLLSISKEVLSHAKTINDKIRVHVALTRAPIVEKNLEHTYATSASVLAELGAKLPLKPDRKYKEQTYSSLKRKLSLLSDDEIMAFPAMTNQERIGALRILGSMITEHMITSKSDSIYLDFIICCMVNLTLEYGLCAESVVGFSILGARLAGAGEINLAQRFAKLSRMLLDIPGIDTTGRPRVLLGTVMVLHWSESLSSLTDQALAAFEYGMRYGDTTTGFSAVLMYSSLYLYSGLPLGPLLEDCKKMVGGLSDYGQHSMLLMHLPIQQCAANLMGLNKDVLNLNQGPLRKLRAKLGWKYGVGGSGEFTEHSLRMQIAFYCEEFDLASNLMKTVKANTPSVTISLWQDQQRTFFYCLLEIHALKSRSAKSIVRRRAHRKEAQKFYTQMRKWVLDLASANSAHKLLILDAEMLSLQLGLKRKASKTERLEQAYDKAIAASTRAGFLQDGALAAHLACRAVRHKESMYWDRAVDLYRKWGAQGIVNHVQKYRNRVPSERMVNDIQSLAGYRGRSRYDGTVVDGHKSIGD